MSSNRGFRPTPIHLDATKLQFQFLTEQDILNLSVKEVTVLESFDVLGNPVYGGPYDPAFGPVSDKSTPCTTCSNNISKCNGHYGHIKLPLAIVNPLFHIILQKILKMTCLKCFTLQISQIEKDLLFAEAQLIEDGHIKYIEGLRQEVMSSLPESKGKGIANLDDALVYTARDIIKCYVDRVYSQARNKMGQVSFSSENDDSQKFCFQRQVYIDNAIKEIKPKDKCINCHVSRPKITVIKNRIKSRQRIRLDNDNDEEVAEEGKEKMTEMMLMPDDLKNIMQRIWIREKKILSMMIPCLNSINVEHPTDIFFLSVVLVVPPLVRPVNMMNGQIMENPQTEVYKSILRNCVVLRNVVQAVKTGDTSLIPDSGKLLIRDMRGATLVEKMYNAWVELQSSCDHLIDRDLSKNSDSVNCHGLRQIVEKKEGVIRMNMMGKRVNFACRTVITPDMNINLDEIGIPEEFAMKLTYPVYVTPHNAAWLRQLVLNGPEKYPGAVKIQGMDGRTSHLSKDNFIQRQAMAKRLLTQDEKATKFLDGTKVVYRHLMNGDVLLLNRQPTLHKPSIMAHKARILKGERTLRLHYANCKSYNADFDGDEMNAHFPQNELARAEAYHIASVPYQYLVPKDGTPLSGLIQDHVISGVKLSLRGNFFVQEDYHHFVYSALAMLPGNIILLPPAIIKPLPMWSGKQIISTIVINIIPRGKARINLTSSAKIHHSQWQKWRPRPWACGVPFANPMTMSEAEVIFRGGELLCGVLDKNHYGATPFGLVHCVYELYGGDASCKLLSAFGKVFQCYLQRIGFTLGIADILVKYRSDRKRAEIINMCRQIGDSVQKEILEVPEDTPMEEVTAKFEENYQSNPKFRKQVDEKYKKALSVYTNNINKACLPRGLIKGFPENNLQLMVRSGAKGSSVNTLQISCLLGQIELEGKRPPLMISGKSLPSFPAYDSSPRAGGFIDGRFMTGIRPQEYFFHCMAGREGLIDTAVKTSRSGYLQRCLIKHLEGVKVEYDSTVRDQDNNIIQFMYGEDGLDILKSQFLNDKQMQFLYDNKDAVVDEDLLKQMKRDDNPKTIEKILKKIKKWKKRHGDVSLTKHASPFTHFSAAHYDPNNPKNKVMNEGSGRYKATISLMRKWIRADDETKNLYKAQGAKCPEPINSRFWQHRTFGVLSEKLEDLLENYVKNKPDMNKSDLRDLISAKVMTTLCQPGEPVGLLAAQSIGEPSTQMTLNTFHFAGRGEMNVTLGIPRLREILMMASKSIKTPSMEIPFKSDLVKLEKQSTKLKLKLTKCCIADVLKEIKIDRKLHLVPQRRMMYSLTFDFLPHKSYKKEFNVHPKDTIEGVKNKFLKAFFQKIKEASTYCSATIMWTDEKEPKNLDEKLDNEEEPNLDESMAKLKGRIDLGETHESSDEEELGEDADATQARRVKQHRENQEYDDPEDEEIVPEEEEGENDEEEKKYKGKEITNTETSANVNTEEESVAPSMEAIVEELSDEKRHVLEKFRFVTDFEYDEEKYRWCKVTFYLPIALSRLDMPSIVREVANKVVLWEIQGVKRAITYQNQKGSTILKTEGINIIEMFKYAEILDLNRLYSNDVYAISQTYGIEAANRVIVKEVKDVFGAYGIHVNPRHLLLVADYMTTSGVFSPLSRKGIESSGSPLHQMSFESSMTFLKMASLQGKFDNLTSPSSRLMLGLPVTAGTGCFEVMLDINKQIELNKYSQPLSFTL
ncbi:DNA-directed RNA polymerase I subunit RPA1 [Copidosoma floridanum]|uniref:DNA-directed RNA polymerase I subunit RPA1 n=1 Tax=Copidosoma floridanum TaxID=29053 RepID=UPI0006C9584E|nr:DNA-directed RNA polymerase I subunit RPA1 [Copidosoma floridanum]